MPTETSGTTEGAFYRLSVGFSTVRQQTPLTAFLIMGRGDAREFGQYPQVYCTTAGGQIVEQDDGSSFCAIWIDRPSQSGG